MDLIWSHRGHQSPQRFRHLHRDGRRQHPGRCLRGSQHSSDTHGHTATVGAIATLCALDGDRQGEIFGDWEYQGIYGGLTIIR